MELAPFRSRQADMRRIVVEDQEDNRQILRDLLINAGFDMIEAENGEEAIAYQFREGSC